MAAPKQNFGFKSDKIWRDAVMRAVKRQLKGEKSKRLELLADRLVKNGIDGETAALREIGDRLDGKSTQPVGGDQDLPLELVIRVIE